jgi:hypothetical protein
MTSTRDQAHYAIEGFTSHMQEDKHLWTRGGRQFDFYLRLESGNKQSTRQQNVVSSKESHEGSTAYEHADHAREVCINNMNRATKGRSKVEIWSKRMIIPTTPAKVPLVP